ncbi:MAG TPA: hypothetical protein VK154_17295 [Chitinophagales bacterium]|nr:hypothetical protein [Chitinophagales bacterium]
MVKKISSAEYIYTLQFDYIETYSLLRGAEYEAFMSKDDEEFKNLHERKKRGAILIPGEEKRYLELFKPKEDPVLINDKNEFHWSSEKIGFFKRSEPRAQTLIEILNTEIDEVPKWRCPPVFRDALVFYDGNQQIVSVLNICFGCENLMNKPLGFLIADSKTYSLLRQFLTDLGHKIEPAN